MLEGLAKLGEPTVDTIDACYSFYTRRMQQSLSIALDTTSILACDDEGRICSIYDSH